MCTATNYFFLSLVGRDIQIVSSRLFLPQYMCLPKKFISSAGVSQRDNKMGNMAPPDCLLWNGFLNIIYC